ncbi:MAG: LysR substrate-binding domain-containing protein, partial [Gammaproteobacteria bacterium]|nr:LysR substrate-binding domain-containing protein [Gammaproteobacteria bacterium]
IMLEVQNIRSLASDLSGEEEGTLSIATTHTQARYVLPEIIKNFRDRYPKVNLELHQGTSEQIAELVTNNVVDFAIATGSRNLFPELVLLPGFHWDRIVLVPKNHELARMDGQLNLPMLANYPLVTYVFSLTGESSFKNAFAVQGLEPDVVFTARDADIIKTYVLMGIGVGIVAGLAYEQGDKENFVALSAEDLFPRCTTWIGFRRDSVLRGYMVDFISLFASYLTPELTREAAVLGSQGEIDALFSDITVPTRGGCGQEDV